MSAHVRATDGDTSRDAALAVEERLNGLCARVYRTVVEVDHRNGGQGATTHDIVLLLAYGSERVPQQSVIARRCTDLRDAGLVADLGVRRVGGYGRELIAWVPVRADGQGVLL